MRVGLVGCGNIGTDICLALQKGDIPAKIAALTDIDRSRAELFAKSFELSARICDVDENAASVDFLVECADVSAVATAVEAAIRYRRDCLILSLGGLLTAPELFDTARQHGVKIWLPSGALAGLDGVRAGREGGLERVTLTTRKPPKGLAGAPWLVERGISLEGLNQPKVVFDGTALEAVKAFPKNVNVAAALSFAGIGPERTRVRVIADPGATANCHEIVAEGAFGRLVATTENQPSPRNAKSSYLASLSGCAELRAAAEAFVLRRSAGAGI
ncbi:MAG TPA: aspartate dehydrogenase [Candidatus Hydrogenedentes bacterium]|jgi:aspartate dehydrogenase|nr:aspartate dehydrogenase [Candidatus Hydrogenedentota bacterium]HPJ99934.1 aspartate dehydrogenase [Candidatus Hydrogenedentota bacterium]